MKKIVIVIACLLFSGFCLAADVKAPVAAKKEAPKAEAPVSPKAKSAEVVVDNFEEEKTDWLAASFMGDSTGMEQTSEDTMLLDLSTKRFNNGKKSLRIEYEQKPAKDNKFAQVSAGNREKTMGDNNAVSFFVAVEKGNVMLTVSLFDKSWNKWVSQVVTVDKKEWKNVTIKNSDFVSTGKGKWADVVKVQIVIKGSGIFYFDDVMFVKADKK